MKNLNVLIFLTIWTIYFSTILFAQKNKKQLATSPDSIAPVGIIKGLSNSALLDAVQHQNRVCKRSINHLIFKSKTQ